MKEQDLRRLFKKKLDRDGNGLLTPNEFKATVSENDCSITLNEAQIDLFIKEADINGDGQLSIEGNKIQSVSFLASNWSKCGQNQRIGEFIESTFESLTLIFERI